MKLHEELRHERQRRGWTLPKLAERMHVSPPAVGSWERANRNPSLDQAEQWANAFGLRLALVPADDEIEYGRINEIVAALATLTDLAPTMAEIIAGIRAGRAELVAALPDESEGVFA